MDKIDWPYWTIKREVETWEAVLLSLGIDPQCKGLDPDEIIIRNPEVAKRLRHLRENTGYRNGFRLPTPHVGDPKLNRVRLAEFAAWWMLTADKSYEAIPEPLSSMGYPIVNEHLAENRRRVGRYLLEEAADLLEQHAGQRAGAMLEKLIKAVDSGALTAYQPLSLARYPSDPVYMDRLESHWQTLNAWLEKNDQQISWRFPDPDAGGDIR